MKAVILDIHRCSMGDGPGIRTTVFLKGCPMQCIWCHNPESISSEKELAFFEERCTLCGECVDVCPNDVHTVQYDAHTIDRSCCRMCGKCVDACVQDALRMTGEELSAAEVMETVMKDFAYYEESGGGLTVSGGEPMYQFGFTLELLKTAQKNGLHTCLDTGGLATREKFEAVLPYVDLFLYDYKATEPDKHKDLTKVSNDLIFENFEFLYHQDARIELRCPIIPGLNDDEAHLNNLLWFKRHYTELEALTIMPYHNTGNAKYQRYGYVNPLPDTGTASEDMVRYWNDRLKANQNTI
jgi:pyruvate formate lyase activating enzyme